MPQAVSVEGAPLPPFPAETTQPDPAVGERAPQINVDGLPVQTGNPQLFAWVAHWCPVCNDELPALVDAQNSGLFNGVDTVLVSVAEDPSRPNYPAEAWVTGSGWEGDVIYDQDAVTAVPFAVSGVPYFVAVDETGNVAGRWVGEAGPDLLNDLVAAVI